MPKNTRWSFNPKKWFGTTLKNRQKHETNSTRLPPPQTATTTTRTIPRNDRMKVIPISLTNDHLQRENSTITQLQLPAFSIRRERSSFTLQRQKTFHPTHTEPTIRKNIRIEEGLAIDTTRFTLPMITTSIYDHFEQRPTQKPPVLSVSNMSNRCLIDYPRHIVGEIEEYSLPSRSSSISSIGDEHDHSSSSGIYSDERQQTPSKETLSTLEVRSIETIEDSQQSLSHLHKRPIIHHYRRPMSVINTVDDKPQRLPSLIRSHRSQSAEDLLRENSIISPIQSRQSSSKHHRMTDQHFSFSRSPLGKVGFIRIANDTYRLSTTTNPLHQLNSFRKNSIDSFAPYANYDDPLPSANNVESYARLPRTSSTEQLNHDQLQNDLRMIVNDCIRPMMHSIGKSRSMKSYQRYKRPTQTQINLEHITDKLISSVDYSSYSRYQRCN